MELAARPRLTRGEAAESIPSRGRPQPAGENESRLPRDCAGKESLDFCWPASNSYSSSGSAKAITASPSTGLLPGSPPKPYTTYSFPLTT